MLIHLILKLKSKKDKPEGREHFELDWGSGGGGYMEIAEEEFQIKLPQKEGNWRLVISQFCVITSFIY